jgi:hypothetical protein
MISTVAAPPIRASWQPRAGWQDRGDEALHPRTRYLKRLDEKLDLLAVNLSAGESAVISKPRRPSAVVPAIPLALGRSSISDCRRSGDLTLQKRASGRAERS